MPIPLQTACDPASPEEHALWALVGLAGPAASAPLVVPTSTLRQCQSTSTGAVSATTQNCRK